MTDVRRSNKRGSVGIFSKEVSMTPIKRCSWCGDDPLYVRYHDEEWGVPVHDDAKLFEFLTLE
jgi:hypothetical protein